MIDPGVDAGGSYVDRTAAMVYGTIVAGSTLAAVAGHWAAARRTGHHGLGQVTSAVASSLIGIVLIALKFALH